MHQGSLPFVQSAGAREDLGPGAVLLRGFALPDEAALLSAIELIVQHAPWRHMITPGGRRMSVGMTNAGTWGWVTDRLGYRYEDVDPETRKPWPPMPEIFIRLARAAAAEAGFDAFTPDACLVNRYEPGSRMSLHQDKDEMDFGAPIVSVSLGVSITFLFGGLSREERPIRVLLHHGDVVVWGGPARLRFHGVTALPDACHPVVGPKRFNLTFRRAKD